MKRAGWKCGALFLCLFAAIFVVQAAALRVVVVRTGLWAPDSLATSGIPGGAGSGAAGTAPSHPAREGLKSAPKAASMVTPLKPIAALVPTADITLERTEGQHAGVTVPLRVALDAPGAHLVPQALPSAFIGAADESRAADESPIRGPGARDDVRAHFESAAQVATQAQGPKASVGRDAVSSIAAGEVASDVDASAGGALGAAHDDLLAEWLRSSPADRLTLQIQAGTNLGGLQAFAANHALPQPQSFVRSVRNGRPWFALVVGDYANARAAEAAATDIRSRLRSIKPWIRRVGNIQAQAD